MIHITAYRFIQLNRNELDDLKSKLLSKAQALEIKGTILLSIEGINISVAGNEHSIAQFRKYLDEYPQWRELHFKESYMQTSPFQRMKVMIKKEIITMGRDDIEPDKMTGAYVTPQQLQEWYQNNRDMVVLDTRNDYEVVIGKFKHAIDLHIQSFSDIPQALEQLPAEMKQKTIVTYCTGGVRCEKVTALMLKMGFQQVYQLEGGIIHYFEQCGNKHFEGECFVFDDRIAINADRQETNTQLCPHCQMPLKELEQTAEKCIYCELQLTANSNGLLRGA